MVHVRRHLRRKSAKRPRRLRTIPPVGLPLIEWNEIDSDLLERVIMRAKGANSEKSWSVLPDGTTDVCEGDERSCRMNPTAVYILHNHPTSPYDSDPSLPSTRDVLNLYSHPATKASIVVDGHGNVWGMRKTSLTSTKSPWKTFNEYNNLERLFGGDYDFSTKFARELGIEMVQLRSQWDATRNVV